MQEEVFNEALISICRCLSYGFGSPPQPLTKDFLRKVSDVIDIDPDFTKVAWELALELTRRSHRHSGNDSNDDDKGNEGHHSGYNTSEGWSEQDTSVSEDHARDQRVPGAWLDEEQKPAGFKVRKFRSIPDNFDSTI